MMERGVAGRFFLSLFSSLTGRLRERRGIGIPPSQRRSEKSPAPFFSPFVKGRNNACQTVSRGFTLIEIMVVVFILGLLVTLVAPKILGRTDEAKWTKAAADLRAIEQALHLYKLDNGIYPTTEQGLQALVTKPESGIIPARWNSEGYLEKVPADPWRYPYLYLSNGERYTLKSLGADGEEGGEGKYADLDSRDL